MEHLFPVTKHTEIRGQFSEKWLDFVTRFSCHQDENGTARKPFLFHYGKDYIENVSVSVTQGLSSDDLSKFSTFVQSLEQECLFQIALSFLRYLFFSHRRKTGSGAKDFFTELKLLSEWCSFDDETADNFIKERIIENLPEGGLREVLLSSVNLTASDMADVCAKVEEQIDATTSELFKERLVDHQQNSFLNSSVDHVWSSYQETQKDINKDINFTNFSTVLSTDHQQCKNDANGMKCIYSNTITARNNYGNPPIADSVTIFPVREENVDDSPAGYDYDVSDTSADTINDQSAKDVNDPHSDISISENAKMKNDGRLTFNFNIHPSQENDNKIPQQTILKRGQVMERNGKKGKMYGCNLCVFKCPSKAGIEKHVLQAHKSLTCCTCPICDSKFPTEKEFVKHLKTEHMDIKESKSLTSTLAIESEKMSNSLLMVRTGIQTITCQICSASFLTEKLLSCHMMSMHPDINKKISTISNASSSQQDSNQNRVIRFTCTKCGIHFNEKKLKEAHKRKFHRTRHFPCEYCSNVCQSNAALITHRRIHTGEKPFMCDICGKGFTMLSTLQIHTRFHTGEKPFKCQYCGVGFHTSYNRIVHEKRHRNERRFICEKCGKAFITSYGLKSHKEIHTEDSLETFLCHCGLKFATERRLKRHEILHSNSKATTLFNCDLCGASYTRSLKLREHQKSQVCQKRMAKLNS